MGVLGNSIDRAYGSAGVRPADNDLWFEASFGEVYRATRDMFEMTGMSTSERRFYQPKMVESLSQSERGREILKRHALESMKTEGSMKRGQWSPQPSQMTHDHETWAESYSMPIDRLREAMQEAEEDLRKAGAPTLADIENEYAEQLEQANKNQQLATARSGTGTMLAGSLAGGMRVAVEDPAVIATALVGGTYRGGSILAFAAREALLQGGVNIALESMILQTNKDIIEQAGMDIGEFKSNILLSGGFGAVFGFASGGVGGRITRGQTDKMLKQLEESLNLSSVDDVVAKQLEGLRERGYKFSPREEALIAQGTRHAQMGRDALRGASPEVRRETAAGVDAVEARMNGGDEAEYQRNAPQGSHRQWDLSEEMSRELETARARVAERLEIERRDKPSKPLKQMLRDLKEVEARAERAAKMADEQQLRMDSAQETARLSRQEVDETAARAQRVEKEYPERMNALEEDNRALNMRLVELNEKHRGRPPARQAKPIRRKLDEIQNNMKAMRDRRAAAWRANMKARGDMEDAARARLEARREMEELLDNEEALARFNEQNHQLEVRPHRADKGDPAPRRDIIPEERTADVPKTRVGDPVPEPKDFDQAQARTMQDSDRWYNDFEERAGAKSDSSELGQTMKGVEEARAEAARLKEIHACFSRGG